MKHSGFGIIELSRNNIPTEAHAMNNSITQADQNDSQISKTIKRIFTRFHVTSALKASGVYHIESYIHNTDFSVPVSSDLFNQNHVYSTE